MVGGRDRVRTCDPLLAKQVLSQLSYTPILQHLHSRILFAAAHPRRFSSFLKLPCAAQVFQRDLRGFHAVELRLFEYRNAAQVGIGEKDSPVAAL